MVVVFTGLSCIADAMHHSRFIQCFPDLLDGLRRLGPWTSLGARDMEGKIFSGLRMGMKFIPRS
jgi:hypothetical protein